MNFFTLKDKDISPIYKDITVPDVLTKTARVRGYDTETKPNGDCFLLCSDSEVHPFVSTEDALRFLLGRGEGNVNFFFNIRFDFEGILKQALALREKSEWDEIRQEREITIGKFKVKFIEKKFWSISTRKKTARFFDVASFFEASLDKLAQEFLGEKKIDLELTNKSDIYSLYLREPQLVSNYCRKDANLTRRLGEKIIETISQFMTAPKNYFSKAYLSQVYAIQKVQNLKIFKPFRSLEPQFCSELLEYWFKSYKGGIFDISRKGRVKGVQIDINSAYPFQIARLPELVYGNWRKVKGESDESNPVCITGVYHVKMQYDGFSPFRRKNGTVVYPRTRALLENYITRDELLFLRERDYKVEVIDGFEYESIAETYPFQKIIDELFQYKKAYEDKPIERQFIKIILNGLYGKFAQTKGKQVGQLFNPVYASLITARTRIKLARKVESDFNEVYELATDSILGKAKYELKGSKELGEFDLKGETKEVVILQCGVKFDVDGKPLRTRGFNPKSEIVDKGESVKITYNRPLHMRETMVRKELDRINEFVTHEKIFKVYDFKREWNMSKNTKFSQLFERSYEGLFVDENMLEALGEI